MRARNIKPGFFKNEYLAELSPFARLLFIGLWLMADKEGRLEYRPKRIKAELLPYDSINIEELLDELCNAKDDSCKFVSKYEVEGCHYLFVHKFVEHQNPHKNEKESVIPQFTNIQVITGQVPNLHHSDPAESVSPILNTDSLNPEKRWGFTPPTVEQVSAYCLERKNDVNPHRFFDFYASKGWFVGKTKMKDWQAAVRTWEREENEKNGKSKPRQHMTARQQYMAELGASILQDTERVDNDTILGRDRGTDKEGCRALPGSGPQWSHD